MPASARRAPNFVFAGHTDVVPPGDARDGASTPSRARSRTGELWGRGACGHEGRRRRRGRRRVAFRRARRFRRARSAFSSPATKRGRRSTARSSCSNGRARAASASIIACSASPPASPALGDSIKNGRRGSLTGRLRLIGKQGHVAYPHLAEIRSAALGGCARGAAYAAARRGHGGFRRLESRGRQRRRRQPRDQCDSRRGPTRLQCAIQRNLDARRHCRRRSNAARRRAAGAQLRTGVRSHECRGVLDRRAGPFTDLVARAIREVTGLEPKLSTGGGTSDARFIKDACPVVELGLVGASMHGVDEHADIEDMEKLSRIYERTLELYFASDAAASGYSTATR